MTSKNLFFKLMKENLKSRIWALALAIITFFFVFPVFAAFSAGEMKHKTDAVRALATYERTMLEWFAYDGPLVVFIMIALALIIGSSSFSYLNSKNRVDFYHSLPVKRELLYAVNYTTGILILAIPYAVMLLLGVFTVSFHGVELGEIATVAVVGWGFHMVYFSLIYTVIVIAAMLTGNIIITLFGTGVLCFIVPSYIMVGMGYFQAFFETYYPSNEELLLELCQCFSPLVGYFTNVFSTSSKVPILWGEVIATIILAVLGEWLYTKRPSEAAGKAMAFEQTESVISVSITILVGLAAGIFFWSMQSVIGWAVFGVICGSILTHGMIQIIYHFDFKQLFACKKQLGICLGVSLAILGIFHYDVVGYDQYLPKAENVESVAINVYEFHNWTSYGEVETASDGGYQWKYIGDDDYIFEHMEVEQIEPVLQLAQAGIAGLEKETTETTFYMKLCYELESGKKVYRAYSVPWKENREVFESLYGMEVLKEGMFPVMELEPEEIAGVYYREGSEEKNLRQSSKEEKELLFKTYLEEFQNLTIADMEQQIPIGLIRFAKEEEVAAIEWEQASSLGSYRSSYYGILDKNYYPVYETFEQTIKLLADQEVACGTYFVQDEVIEMQFWTYDREKEMDVEVTITDSEELNQLVGLIYSEDICYYNRFALNEDISINVRTKDGSYGAVMRDGTLPEYIKEQLY